MDRPSFEIAAGQLPPRIEWPEHIEDQLDRRECFFDVEPILEPATAAWRLVSKNGTTNREAFEGLFRRFARVLIPDLGPAEVASTARLEWEKAETGEDQMNFPQFLQAVTNFAKCWLPDADDTQQAFFLEQVLSRCTVRLVCHEATGVDPKVSEPRLCLQFFNTTVAQLDSQFDQNSFSADFVLQQVDDALIAVIGGVAYFAASKDQKFPVIEDGSDSHAWHFDEHVVYDEDESDEALVCTGYQLRVEGDELPFGMAAVSFFAWLNSGEGGDHVKLIGLDPVANVADYLRQNLQVFEPGPDMGRNISMPLTVEDGAEAALALLVSGDALPKLAALPDHKLQWGHAVQCLLTESGAQQFRLQPHKGSVLRRVHSFRKELQIQGLDLARSAGEAVYRRYLQARAKERPKPAKARLPAISDVLTGAADVKEHGRYELVHDPCVLSFCALSELGDAWTERGGVVAPDSMHTLAGAVDDRKLEKAQHEDAEKSRAANYIDSFPETDDLFRNNMTDLLDFARAPPVTLVVVGEPGCGTSSYCQALAAKLDLQLLQLEYLLQVIMEMPPTKLTKFQSRLRTDLLSGGEVTASDGLKLMLSFMDSAKCKTVGYVLDVPAISPEDNSGALEFVEILKTVSSNKQITEALWMQLQEIPEEVVEEPPPVVAPPPPVEGEGEGDGEEAGSTSPKPPSRSPSGQKDGEPLAEGEVQLDENGNPIEKPRPPSPPPKIDYTQIFRDSPYLNMYPRMLIRLRVSPEDAHTRRASLKLDCKNGRVWSDFAAKSLQDRHSKRQAWLAAFDADPDAEKPEEEEVEIVPVERPEEVDEMLPPGADVLQRMEIWVPPPNPLAEPEHSYPVVPPDGEAPKKLPPLPEPTLMIAPQWVSAAPEDLSQTAQEFAGAVGAACIPSITIAGAERTIEEMVSVTESLIRPRFHERPRMPLRLDAPQEPKDLLSCGTKDIRQEVEAVEPDPTLEGAAWPIIDGVFRRRWTAWRQFCPVSLHQGKLAKGDINCAAEWAGRVFCFATEEYQSAFLLDPRKYLREAPAINRDGVALGYGVIGPPAGGAAALAKGLADAYHFDLVDINATLQEILDPAGGLAVNEDGVVIDPTEPGLFPDEWKEIFDNAQPVPVAIIARTIAQKLGLAPNYQVIKDRLAKIEELKAILAQEEQPDPPPNIEVDDDGVPVVPLSQPLIKRTKGFVLAGGPESAELYTELKNNYGMVLEKIIYQQIVDSEDAVKDIIARRVESTQVPVDDALAAYETNLGELREAGAEDLLGDPVPIERKPEEQLHIARLQMDPFLVKIDEEDEVDPSPADPEPPAEPDEDEEDAPTFEKDPYYFPFGATGPYDPVTLAEERWLVPGVRDNEAQVGQRVFWFANEDQKNKFVFNPSPYVPSGPPDVPPPRVWVTGAPGSGVTSLCNELSREYGIPILKFKEAVMKEVQVGIELKKKVAAEKAAAAKLEEPYPEEDEDDKPPEEGEQEEPELEWEDTEKEDLYIAAVKKVFGPHLGACIVDGQFYPDPEAEEDDPEELTLKSLLPKALRTPDLFLMLMVGDEVAVNRKLNLAEIDRVALEELDEKKKERDEAIKKAEQEAEEMGEDPSAVADEYPEIEEYDEETMPSKIARDAFVEHKNKVDEILGLWIAEESRWEGGLSEEMVNRKVQVVPVSADRPLATVLKASMWHLRPVVNERQHLISKTQAQLLQPKVAKTLMNMGLAKVSKLGRAMVSDFDAHPDGGLTGSEKYPVLLHDRIYYPGSQEAREIFLRAPVVPNGPGPCRWELRPAVAVVGPPGIGKSTLAVELSRRLGCLHLTVPMVLQHALQGPDGDLQRKIRESVVHGQEVPSEIICAAVAARLTRADVLARGWVLDGFPRGAEEATMLTGFKVIPHVVLALHAVGKRSACAMSAKKPGGAQRRRSSIKTSDSMQLVRLQAQKDEEAGLVAHYSLGYGNVVELDGTRSKWALASASQAAATEAVRRRCAHYRRFAEGKAYLAAGLGIPLAQLKNKRSEYGNYCPVTWHMQGALRIARDIRFAVVHFNQVFWMASEEYAQQFLDNPEAFQLRPLPVELPSLIRLRDRTAPGTKIVLEGHCPVVLSEKNSLVKEQHYVVKYGDRLFAITRDGLPTFMSRPYDFADVELPALRPPPRVPDADKVLKTVNALGKQTGAKSVEDMGTLVSFLQVSVGESVCRALLAANRQRAKHPTRSAKASALLVAAKHLRKHNPLNTELEQKRADDDWEQFMKELELPSQLGELIVQKRLAAESEGGATWGSIDQRRYHEVSGEFDAMFAAGKQ